MKKASFYSYHRQSGGKAAVLHEGYDDGTFYYYKSKDNWFCIDKVSGLCITNGGLHTREEAYKEAHSEEIMKFYLNAKEQKWYKEAVKDFENAKMEVINK